MKAWEVIGYTADADIWCPGCAAEAYGHGIRESLGKAIHPIVAEDATDSEGNPVHPVFASDEISDGETCNACGGELL